MAISSPSQSNLDVFQAGHVRIVSLNGLSGNTTIDELKPRTSFDNEDMFSRLGYSLDLLDVNGDSTDDLILSQPWVHVRPSDNRTADAGRLFVFMGGKDFPRDNVDRPVDRSSVCFEASDLHALFGSVYTSVSPSFHGVSSNQKDLFASSPFSSQVAEQAGVVTLIVLPL